MTEYASKVFSRNLVTLIVLEETYGDDNEWTDEKCEEEIKNHHMELIECNIADTSRWSEIYEYTFKYDDKFYGGSYSVGATESQDERPFEYEDEFMELTEYAPKEVMKIEYVPVEL